MKSVGLNLMPLDFCIRHSYFDNNDLHEDEFCAGLPPDDKQDTVQKIDGQNENVKEYFVTRGGKDSCDGDSGGPLICDIEGSAVLVGVTSWGGLCGYSGHPGVYANVHFFADWIRDGMYYK